jgi:hypothetical protein
MALTLAEARTEVLRVISNQNRSTEATRWIQEAVREVQRRGRWNFLQISAVRDMDDVIPADATALVGNEIIEPLFIDTAQSGIGTAWIMPTAPWKFDEINRLYTGKGDYFIDQTLGIVFSGQWRDLGGGVWINYYRTLDIPTVDAVEIDLPDMWVYDLVVYGACRHGLLGEDDYDRLKIATARFESAIKEMKEWDSRRGIANAARRLGQDSSSTFGIEGGNPWGANFSII